MKTQSHLLASVAFTPLIPVLGVGPVFWMMASSILIDLDHLELIIKERAFTPEKMRFLIEHIYDHEINGRPNRAYVDVLYPFHLFEFNLILFLFSFQYHVLLYVFVGFLFHIICDAIHDWRFGLPVARWLFFFYYVAFTIKRKAAAVKTG